MGSSSPFSFSPFKYLIFLLMKSYRSHSKCWRLGVLLQMSPGSSCSSCRMKGGLFACFCRHHLSASSLDRRTQSNLTSFWHIAGNLILPSKEMHKHHTGCLTSHFLSCLLMAVLSVICTDFTFRRSQHDWDQVCQLGSYLLQMMKKGVWILQVLDVLHMQRLNRNFLHRFNKHCQAVL